MTARKSQQYAALTVEVITYQVYFEDTTLTYYYRIANL